MMLLLRKGMYNSPAVLTLQQRLNAILPANEKIAEDSDFGQKTFLAVVAIQRLAKIDIDGVFGPDSETALKKLEASKLQKNVDAPAAAKVAKTEAAKPGRTTEGDAAPSADKQDYSRLIASAIQQPSPKVDVAEMLRIRVDDIVPANEFNAVARRCGISPVAMRAGLERSVEKINDLHPEFRASIMFGMRDAYDKGVPAYLADGFRDASDQRRAYKRGKSGALPGQSFHNYAMGCDIVPMAKDGTGDYEESARGYAARADTIRQIFTGENGRGLYGIKGDRDPLHFTMFPETRSEVSWIVNPRLSVPQNLELFSKERYEGGFLKIPHAIIPAQIRDQTKALIAERSPKAESVARREGQQRLPVMNVAAGGESSGHGIFHGLCKAVGLCK